jgi:excisionase family DNA binding protein
METVAKKLLTVEEVAKRLSISRTHVYTLMERGELAYVKLSKSRRVPEEAVEQLVNRNLVVAR